MKLEEKASLKLLDLLNERDYYILPKYPFKLSFDEVIANVYWYEDEPKDLEKLKRELEDYSKWCLDNLDLLEEVNK